MNETEAQDRESVVKEIHVELLRRIEVLAAIRADRISWS